MLGTFTLWHLTEEFVMFRTLFGKARKMAAPARRCPTTTCSKRSAWLRLERLEDRLAPATHVWQGAVSDLWSDDGNWSSGGSPAGDTSGDVTVVFPATDVARFTSKNDISGPFELSELEFDGTGFDITGNGINSFALLSIDARNTTGTNQIDVVDLNAFLLFHVAAGGTLNVTSTCVDDFSKDGQGTVNLSGANEGAKSVLNEGTLIVGNNKALGSQDFVLISGTIQSGAAGTTITLANNFTVAGPATVSGSLAFTGTVHILAGQTLTVASDGFVRFAGIIFGPGSLIKQGNGRLDLDGANTYEGGTLLQGGDLMVGNNTALGSGTLTLSGGSLDAETSVSLANDFKVSSDSQVFDIARFGADSIMTLSGAGTLAAGATLTVETLSVDAHAPIVFSGALGGNGAVTVRGFDSATFSGTDANTYTGVTKVIYGDLFLNKPANVNAIAGPLVIGDGTDQGLSNPVVSLEADNQIERFQPVTINSYGRLKLNNHNQDTGSVTGFTHSHGGMGDPPTWTIGFNNESTTFAGDISGPGTIVKVGTGTWTLTGTNTYTGGTIVDAGTLRVDGAGSIGDVTVHAQGTLAGTGATGAVTLSPGVNVSPGGSTPGILHVQSIAFPTGSTLVVRLNGPTAGIDYDQLQVSGTVDLGGATLSASLSPAFLPVLGTSFGIITSTDTISGTFAGHPDGDTFLLGGTVFQIRYVNDGNNHAVVLTAVAYATSTAAHSSPALSTYGQTVTFSALVQTVSPGAGTPTGTVTFREGTNVLANALPLDGNGLASFSTATLSAGTHNISAQYNPATGFADSSAGVGQIVNPAPLSVTANDFTKITGEVNPAFTVSFDGFVLGEGPSVLSGLLTFSTSATTSSPPGAYAITPGGLTSSNYALTFVSGTLTVLSFAQATTNLVNQVTAANLDHGIENSLLSILDAAIDSFNRGDNATGANQLAAFANHVRAQRGKKISVALADTLIADAQRIINVAGA
jgi:autotransporter-associated beta strand protein